MEITRFTVADRARVGDAPALTSLPHAQDRRQPEPYINHYADLWAMPTWRRELLAAA
jgi:hypothetical protein